MCSIVLLSSCTLTQQQAPLSAEDAAAQSRAASELDAALIVEEERLIKEAREEEKRRARENAEKKAREEAEEKAREEAEAKAEAEERAREEAEEKAREEAEARAEEKAREEELKEEGNRSPQLLSSRRRQKAQDEVITPTAEQQKTARKMLAEQAAKSKAKAEKKAEPATISRDEEQEEMQLPGSELSGGLRTRRFAPPEEAISRDDNDEPLPNSVEMRGLRSPVMKGNLPMNIDGKIIKED